MVITGDSMRLGSPIRESCKFDTALERYETRGYL